MKRAIGLAGLLATVVVSARGQETLLPSTGWGTGAVMSAWYFSTPLPQSGGSLRAVAQMAVPFRVRTVFGSWSADLSGSVAAGGAYFEAPDNGSNNQGGNGNGGSDNGGRFVSLYGPTDVKLRFTGPIVGDNLLLTAGVNVPTGKASLNGDETIALQALGAPALRMPVASFGTGAGFTLGVIRAFDFEDWALALGASVEERSEYSPIALLLSNGVSQTKVTPGAALHFSAGLDRPLGENRLSLLVVADQFAKDKVRLDNPGDASNDYQLGPQVTATARIELAGARWRESSLNIAARSRSEFSDATGTKVSGSSGTYLEASYGGILGAIDHNGFIFGVDGRWHSGLTFTDALVGAATTAGGVTLGVEIPHTRSLTRFTVHGQYGTFDTGTAHTTGMGISIGLSVSARREVQ